MQLTGIFVGGPGSSGTPWVVTCAVSELLLDFSFTVKAAPHECVIRTSQP